LSFEYGVDLEGAPKVTGERAKAEWIKFSVSGDGRRLWSSEWVRWKDRPEPVEVAIRNVRELTLKVEGGGSQWLYGSAAWGKPTLRPFVPPEFGDQFGPREMDDPVGPIDHAF
jgi:hypothetical protein